MTKSPGKSYVILTNIYFEEMFSLLDELDELHSENSFQRTSLKNDVESIKMSSRQESEIRRQCSPVLLSGTMSSQGLSSISSPRACDNLLCLSCNLPVVSLDNLQWDSSTDYLFLRNNIPNVSKLRGVYFIYGCSPKKTSSKILPTKI